MEEKLKTGSENSENFRCGVVAIVGRPNVGKSTLLNAILKEKVAIVSPVPQTTRNQVRGIYNDERGQIIFIDTPGVHRPKDKLDEFMNKSAIDTFYDADCLIHLVDSHEPVGQEEESIVRKLAVLNIPIVLGLNKVDVKKNNLMPQYISLWEEIAGKPVQQLFHLILLPLSGEKGTNVEKLIDLIFEQLPKGPALYPPDILSDFPQRLAMADIVREKLFSILRQELPHAVAVVIEDVQKRPGKTIYIQAVILVEKESQKEIVIGSGGQVLKKVGVLARQDLEDILESRIFLDLYVKARKNWRDNASLLNELGYSSS